MKPILSLFILSALMACSQKPIAPSPPLSPRLEQLFVASCALCHVAPRSQPPQLGDDSWDAIWDKGFGTLMTHTMEGFGGMPPVGGCAACSYEDLALLVQHLAQRSVQQP